MDRQEIIFKKIKSHLKRELGVSPVTAADLATAHLGSVLGALLVEKIIAERIPYCPQTYPGPHPYGPKGALHATTPRDPGPNGPPGRPAADDLARRGPPG